MSDREPTGWITLQGHHIPIYEGESKQDAINRSIAQHNEEHKQWQILQNKKQADTLKESEKKLFRTKNNLANEHTQDEHKKAVDELNKSKYKDGTYDISNKKTVEFSKGYQVTFCQIGDNYNNKDYATKVNECLKLSSDGKTYAGKFEGTPEISFHFNSREQAIAYAKANNQISIWDWENCVEIKTGGTGRRK